MIHVGAGPNSWVSDKVPVSLKSSRHGTHVPPGNVFGSTNNPPIENPILSKSPDAFNFE